MISKNVKRKKFQLHWLSEYRAPLMGICALGVILCHANISINNVKLPKILALLFGCGNYGVDVFLLLSGIGMYYSLNKSSSLKNWYYRRFLTIGIPYCIIAIPFYIWHTYINDLGVIGFLYHFSTIGFWRENFGAWYIALLIPLYFLTPFFGKLIDKSKRRWWTVSFIIITILLLCSIGVNYSSNEVIKNLCTRFMRTPCYFLGYGIGKSVKEEKTINWMVFPVSIIIIGILLKTSMLYTRWAYSFLGIPFAMLGCGALQLFRAKWFHSFMHWFGLRSLESYLCNIFLPFALRNIYDIFCLNFSNYLHYTIVIVLGTLLSHCAYIIRVNMRKHISNS